MSSHFSKQDLVESALNCLTFSSKNFVKRSKSYTSNKLSKLNVLLGSCCVYSLDDFEKSCLVFVAWFGNLESFAYILESSSEISKRNWSLMTLLIIFCYMNLSSNKDFNLFSLSKCSILSHQTTIPITLLTFLQV